MTGIPIDCGPVVEPCEECGGTGTVSRCQSCADLLAALRETREELKQWTTWGIIEIAVRNPNIASYMNHWEDRAEAAERERDRLKASLKLVTGILATLARLEQEMRESVTDCRHVDDRRVYEWANQLAALRGKE